MLTLQDYLYLVSNFKPTVSNFKSETCVTVYVNKNKLKQSSKKRNINKL